MMIAFGIWGTAVALVLHAHQTVHMDRGHWRYEALQKLPGQ